AAALWAMQEEQGRMWDAWWQASRAAMPDSGPLTWVLTLDGYRLSGSHLPPPETPAREAPHDPSPRTTRPALAPAYDLGRSATWWIAGTVAQRGVHRADRRRRRIHAGPQRACPCLKPHIPHARATVAERVFEGANSWKVS